MKNTPFHYGTGDNTGADPDQQPDEQLIKLLNDLYAANEASTAYKDDPSKVPQAVKDRLNLARNDLTRWCEEHLRRSMKAIMFKTFGLQIAKDGSLRFTVLWHDVLAKVLKSGRLEAREGDIIRSLTSYFSNALANQARPWIKPLVELREKYLLENYNIDLESLLNKVDEWEKAGDVVGSVLRLRYIDGMTYEQIAEATGCSRDQVKRILANGRERLQNMVHRS